MSALPAIAAGFDQNVMLMADIPGTDRIASAGNDHNLPAKLF
ncbi:hypothetical protein [Bradyrhizobium sp. Arg816]|nr:hypothetical protein [Bradyrhizobium sp. Arg816]MDI3562266.1 hypothetical protein [Bradyrhizobium sp. Arg816]